MKATDVIRRDHEAAKTLFDEYKNTLPENREPLAKKIFKALTAHELMEDTYFYPALMDVASDEDKAVFNELEGEQKELEMETMAVRAMDIFTDQDEHILKLMDKVLNHATKEENIVLARADQIMDPAVLEELGEKMEPESAVAKTAEEE